MRVSAHVEGPLDAIASDPEMHSELQLEGLTQPAAAVIWRSR